MSYASGPPPLGRHLFPPAIAAGVPVSVAAGVMARRGVDTLVVIEDGAICGVLTERDLVRTAVQDGAANDVDVADVCCRDLGQLMTPEPLVIHGELSVAEAADIMLEAGSGSAVALDGDGSTGVVTGHDIATATGTGQVGPDEPVESIAVKISPLSIDDDVARAVLAMEASGGRPVPVVEGHDIGEDIVVGTVRVSVLRTSNHVPGCFRPEERRTR